MARVTRLRTNFIYGNRSIPYSMWYSGKLAEINTILLLGTVQVGVLAKAVAKIVPKNVMVVQGAPHWYAKSNGSDIPFYIRIFTQQSIDTIFEKIEKDVLVTLITDSQAAPGAVRYCLSSKRIKQLILIQPLGLNSSFFCGDSTIKPIAVLKKRVAQNFRYQTLSIITDWHLLRNHIILSTVSIRDAILQRSKHQYAAGLCYDMGYDLTKLIKITSVRIISGANDKLFPADEIAVTLQKYNINTSILTVVPNIPHSPLSTRQGRRLLDQVFSN